MNVLFVCTGNTCRSPMAQAIFEKMLSEKNLSYKADSAGIYAIPGQKTAENTLKVLEKNFDITDFSHSAKPCTKETIDRADLVIGMTENHRDLLINLFGNKEKILSLPLSVGDPYGGDLPCYEKCGKEIEKALLMLFEKGVFDD